MKKSIFKFATVVLGMFFILGSVQAAPPSQEAFNKLGQDVKSEYQSLKTPAEKKKYKEDLLMSLEKDLSPSLPIQMSDGIVWTKVKFDSKKDVISYTYQLADKDSKELKETTKNKKAFKIFRKEFYGLFCANPVMSSILELGVSIDLEYVDQKNQKVIPNTKIENKTCLQNG